MRKTIIKNSVRKFRFENNEMSQQELADKAGVTRQAIISIEKGAYYPSLELAFRIARVFNAGVEDVFSFEEDDNNKP